MALLNFNEFQWRSMTAAINEMPAAPRLLQDIIFNKRNTNPASTVDVDVIVGDKMVLPFVSDFDSAVVLEKLGREMRSVRTGRIRVKKHFTAHELLTDRAPGQGFYASGGQSVAAQRQYRLGLELQDMRNRIDTTVEYMCAQALTGTVTMSGEVNQTVTYPIPEAHVIELDDKLWTDDDGNPAGNLQDWANLIVNAIGVGPTVAILGTEAAKALIDRSITILDNRRVTAGEFNWKASSNYLGNLLGIDLYVYGGQYKDSTGTAQNLVGTDKVIMVATQARFTIEYGLILDLKADASVQAEYFSKSWESDDPSGLFMLAESRPLPVIWQPEAVVYADVL